MAHKMVHWAFSCCIFLNGVKTEVHGYENIPQDEPILFVSNHRSYWDILVLHNTIKRPLGFVAKIEMKKFPILNWWMSDIGCVFLNRDDPREGLKAIHKGIDNLKAGHNMVICPEGTRNHNAEMLPFKEGSLKMAEKSKCRIVPVALIGTDDLLENNKGFTMKKGKVIVSFGKPLSITDIPEEYKKKHAAYVQTIVKSMLDEYSSEC